MFNKCSNMNLFEAIENRRTIRGFSKAPVEFDKISLIIQTATQAPSPGNLQNWKFIIVTEKEKIKAIPDYCNDQLWIAEAPVVIIACALPEWAIERFGEPNGRDFTIQGVSAAIQNMLLAAHSLELGAAWVGSFDKDMLKDKFQIPPDVEPIALIPIGYPNYDTPKKGLKPIEGLVYFHRYGQTISNLNRVLKDYNVDLKKLGDKASVVTNEAAKYLAIKFEEFKKNFKSLLNLK